jgi:hypothetical protein
LSDIIDSCQKERKTTCLSTIIIEDEKSLKRADNIAKTQ